MTKRLGKLCLTLPSFVVRDQSLLMASFWITERSQIWEWGMTGLPTFHSVSALCVRLLDAGVSKCSIHHRSKGRSKTPVRQARAPHPQIFFVRKNSESVSPSSAVALVRDDVKTLTI